MAKNKSRDQGCEPSDGGLGCCKVESVLSIDDRGQLVLPKEVREKANIRAGDKLALMSWEKGGQICCFIMIRADDLTKMVTGMLGPMVKDIVKE